MRTHFELYPFVSTSLDELHSVVVVFSALPSHPAKDIIRVKDGILLLILETGKQKRYTAVLVVRSHDLRLFTGLLGYSASCTHRPSLYYNHAFDLVTRCDGFLRVTPGQYCPYSHFNFVTSSKQPVPLRLVDNVHERWM